MLENLFGILTRLAESEKTNWPNFRISGGTFGNRGMKKGLVEADTSLGDW